MNRFNLAAGAGLFVLAAGLASCSQEQTSKDSYKTPPPVIMTGNGRQDLLQWERSSDKALDLQDAFDVSAGNPARTEVLARCMRDKANFTEKFSVNGRKPVKIFQVVPQDLLVENLSAADVNCDWEVSLYNEIGSRHVIRLANSPLSDRGQSEISIQSSQGGESMKLVQILKADGVRIRYRNFEPASAEILCHDMNFDPLPFERALELSQFDLQNPVYRPGRGELDVARAPLQTCRVAITESGQIKELSQLLTLHIPLKPLEIVAAGADARAFATASFTQPVQVEVISIHNPTDADRLVQVPRFLDVHSDIQFAPYSSTAKSAFPGVSRIRGLPMRAIQIQPLNPFQAVKEEPTEWTIKIAARGTLKLAVHFKFPYHSCIRSGLIVTGYAATPSPLTLTEVTASGEWLKTIDIEVAEISRNMNFLNFREIRANACF